MRIPQLQINQSMGQIGIRWQRGSFDMEVSSATIEIDYGNPKPFQILAQPQIDQPPAKLTIDKTEFLEDVQFRKFKSLVKHLKGLAKKKIIQGTTEIASEGDQLAKIENKGNMIAQLAKKELVEDKPNITIKSISPPDIKVKTNTISVKFKPANIEVKNNFSFPKVKASGDQVDIYLKHKGKLEIEVVNNVDYHI
ncbi:hypothetical protein U472_03560 [Orenia metallireducens]|jgi:hypothetical protein|uniref:Uncharacterized protein n=1 Tax=Orenia metallireducens TaxID=1413210 RepID=A0A1C0AB83_9FIRM|nr:DUF6470 family protein [Orenia metallireducens]OCL27639.1 hypothetical protein U472_03560 [Orenia metallireducens]